MTSIHPELSKILTDFDPVLTVLLEDALARPISNFRSQLFPSLVRIDERIPGVGFQYVIWVGHSPKFPFPGWEFDAIARPMRYIPDLLATGAEFVNTARFVGHLSGSHVEDCVKEACRTLDPSFASYSMLPLGTLVRRRPVQNLLGMPFCSTAAQFASRFVNKAKHEFGTGTPSPVISFPNAMGIYFASRILGAEVLNKIGMLTAYVDAMRRARAEGRVYVMPEGPEPDANRFLWSPQKAAIPDPDDGGKFPV
jgi:hypothetical protein